MEIKVLWNNPTPREYSWVCPECGVKNVCGVGSHLNKRGEVEYKNLLDINKEKCGRCKHELSLNMPLEIRGVYSEEEL